MHLITITYERLYNLGNYENERLQAQVAVGPDEDPQVAFSFAKSVVVEQHARLQAEREAEQQRQREEYDARQRQARIERDAARAQPTTDEPLF